MAICVAAMCLVPSSSRCATVPATLGPAVRTLAGDGLPGFRDGPALQAEFLVPAALAYGSAGQLYIADRGAQRIRVLRAGGVGTIAGSGQVPPGGIVVSGGYADGPALGARFNRPTGLAVGPDGSVYVADELNHCIRRSAGGTVSTFAGSPDRPGSADGAIAAASFSFPRSLSFDGDGNLYVADYSVGLRMIARDGTVTTLALPPGSIKNVVGVSAWGKGSSLAVWAVGAQTVAIYHPPPAESVIWGSRTEGDQAFPHPFGVAALNAKEALIADTRSHVIRIFRDEDKPFVTTVSAHAVAGVPFEDENAAAGFRDGPVGNARFDAPLAVVAFGGQVVVADAGNRRLRWMPLPNLRGPAGSDFTQFGSQERGSYRIAYVSSSFAFWHSEWDSSVAGLIESRLSSDRQRIGLNGSVHVSVARLDATPLQPTLDFVDQYLADGNVNLVLLSLNVGHLQGLAGANIREQGRAMAPLLRDLRVKLQKSGTQLFVVSHPESLGISPVEALVYQEESPSVVASDQNDALADEREFAKAIQGSGVPSATFMGDFLSYENGPRPVPLFGADDTHFTAAGNAFYAGLIVRALEAKKPWASR